MRNHCHRHIVPQSLKCSAFVHKAYSVRINFDRYALAKRGKNHVRIRTPRLCARSCTYGQIGGGWARGYATLRLRPLLCECACVRVRSLCVCVCTGQHKTCAPHGTCDAVRTSFCAARPHRPRRRRQGLQGWAGGGGFLFRFNFVRGTTFSNWIAHAHRLLHT